MTSSNVDINPYILDGPSVETLRKEFDSADLTVKPKKVGYRLIEDYFGDDVVEFLLDYEGALENDLLSQEDNQKTIRVVSDWRWRHFPEYTMMVQFAN